MNFKNLILRADQKLVCEKVGDNYQVRSLADNAILVSTQDGYPIYKIAPHVGHDIGITLYGSDMDHIVNAAIECSDCYEVLFDLDAE